MAKTDTARTVSLDRGGLRDEQLVAMSEKFPEQFAQFPAPLRMRAEAALARWAEEDARDAAEVFGLVG